MRDMRKVYLGLDRGFNGQIDYFYVWETRLSLPL
jgi:hypothetical protein